MLLAEEKSGTTRFSREVGRPQQVQLEQSKYPIILPQKLCMEDPDTTPSWPLDRRFVCKTSKFFFLAKIHGADLVKFSAVMTVRALAQPKGFQFGEVSARVIYG